MPRSTHQRAPALERFRHIKVRHGTQFGIRLSFPRRARRARRGARFLLLPTNAARSLGRALRRFAGAGPPNAHADAGPGAAKQTSLGLPLNIVAAS
jgi:hypothetical protein